ncbi:MAG: 2Fe-2S iron-sulfur cluster-binding protein [Acidobacteriota bacterium]|nr:2Fe-2S iron-sulfur cluster-binding protein [Acidobacteriota bacterium]
MATPFTISLSINRERLQPVSVADGTEPLLYVLRNQFGLHGPKFGCGVAQCGSCTVHVNGVITRSCVTQTKALPDRAQVITLEGLTRPDDSREWESSNRLAGALGTALQESFVEQQAAQCGYCANAMIMGASGWLQNRRSAGNRSVPTDDEVKAFLSGIGQTPAYVYLCRCGTHLRIIRAIQQAAERMR